MPQQKGLGLGLGLGFRVATFRTTFPSWQLGCADPVEIFKFSKRGSTYIISGAPYPNRNPNPHPNLTVTLFVVAYLSQMARVTFSVRVRVRVRDTLYDVRGSAFAELKIFNWLLFTVLIEIRRNKQKRFPVVERSFKCYAARRIPVCVCTHLNGSVCVCTLCVCTYSSQVAASSLEAFASVSL